MKSFITTIGVLSPGLALLAHGRVVARQVCSPVSSEPAVAIPASSAAPVFSAPAASSPVFSAPAASAPVASAPAASSAAPVSQPAPASSGGAAVPSGAPASSAAPAAPSASSGAGGGGSCALPSSYQWTDAGGPLVEPANGWVSLKDFTTSLYNGQYLVYASNHDDANYGSMSKFQTTEGT